MTVYSPPVNTYTPLASITLAGGASSVTLTGFSQDYRDLILVCNFQMSGASSASRLRLNGDTGSNYYGVLMAGTGSTTTSYSESAQTGARIFGASVGPANSFSNVATIQVMDYSATDKQKTVLTRFGSASAETQATASRWASTSAVTSITIFDVLSYTYTAGSTFSLFGIKA